GYYVDLFCSEAEPPRARLAEGDIDPIPTAGGNWLAAAPKTEAVVIGQDGLPARMVCVDPRIFALHKWWLSKQRSRQAASRPRDAQQAHVVAVGLTEALGGLLFTPSAKSMFAFGLLVLVLLFRPLPCGRNN